MQTFNIEHQAFETARERLVRESNGKYVVIKGQRIGPALESFQEALRWGYSHFDLSGFCVKQLAAQDPVCDLSERLAPCAD